mgnify:FL=1
MTNYACEHVTGLAGNSTFTLSFLDWLSCASTYFELKFCSYNFDLISLFGNHISSVTYNDRVLVAPRKTKKITLLSAWIEKDSRTLNSQQNGSQLLLVLGNVCNRS